MQELGMMGESNATFLRRERTPFDTLLATAAYYQENFQLEDGTIPATFEVIYTIGWAPHESQQKSKARGSAVKSIGEGVDDL
jgi:NADH dehydrogenase [ubiquinone] 1 alpha subcomplex assembly factor 5